MEFNRTQLPSSIANGNETNLKKKTSLKKTSS